MQKTIDINWKDGMAFETEIDGHKITVDAGTENGGKDSGPRPKALMMLALGGCTGMDVVSILKKMRVELDGFNMKIEGNMTEEHPKHFDKMHIIYEFEGKDLPKDKIEKAVNLSKERYCGVNASYEKAMEMTHEIVIK